MSPPVIADPMMALTSGERVVSTRLMIPKKVVDVSFSSRTSTPPMNVLTMRKRIENRMILTVAFAQNVSGSVRKCLISDEKSAVIMKRMKKNSTSWKLFS